MKLGLPQRVDISVTTRVETLKMKNAKLFINKTAKDKVSKIDLPLLGCASVSYGDDFYFAPFPYSSREIR